MILVLLPVAKTLREFTRATWTNVGRCQVVADSGHDDDNTNLSEFLMLLVCFQVVGQFWHTALISTDRLRWYLFHCRDNRHFVIASRWLWTSNHVPVIMDECRNRLSVPRTCEMLSFWRRKLSWQRRRLMYNPFLPRSFAPHRLPNLCIMQIYAHVWCKQPISSVMSNT